MNPSRQQSEAFGRRAEALCVWYLRAKGYRLVARRARTPLGEIDLVLKRGPDLVFAEVKARASGAGEIPITVHQRDRIIRAGIWWRSHHSRYAHLSPRFDVIVWQRWAWPRHIRAAWTLQDGDSLRFS